MDFVWDDDKAAKNERKHGVEFSTAFRVFSDQGRYEEFDNEHSENEDRWLAIGNVRGLLLSVVFTMRGEDTIRIISARKASKDEQETYYKNHRRP